MIECRGDGSDSGKENESYVLLGNFSNFNSSDGYVPKRSKCVM